MVDSVHWATKGMINTDINIPNYYSIQMVWKIWLAPVYSYGKHCGMCAVTQWKVEKFLKLKGSL